MLAGASPPWGYLIFLASPHSPSPGVSGNTFGFCLDVVIPLLPWLVLCASPGFSSGDKETPFLESLRESWKETQPA